MRNVRFLSVVILLLAAVLASSAQAVVEWELKEAITCVKGKVVRKVSGAKCPKDFKKK